MGFPKRYDGELRETLFRRQGSHQSLIALDFLHLMAQAKQQITGYQLPGVSLYQGSGVGTLDNAIRSEIPHSAFSMRAGWKGRTSVVPTGEAYFMDELILSAPADTVTLSGGTAQALTALGTSRVYEAIQFAQSLGVENPVLNSWQVPGVYLDTTQMGGNYGEFETGALSYTDGNGTTYQTSGGRGGRLKGLIGINDKTNNSTLLFEYKTVKNKRVLVGEHNRYVLASTCSGNQAEYNPEDLYDFVNPTTAPYIWVIADPRPNGMPYARFKILHGDETEELFFLNAVPGMVWQRVPLIFYDKTGNALNQTQFKAETVVKDYNAEMDAIKHTGPFAGILSGNPISAAGAVAGSFTSGLSSMGGYLFGTNEQSFGNARAALNEVTDPSAQIRREREQQKSLELQKYQIGNAIVSPTIQFPRSESVRDLIGNGFVSYRYRYTDADAERIDQIMTAYGYKVTTMITANNQGAILNGRPRFNYVEIKGASVTTGRPKWMNDELSSALSTGLRIWHEKPDPTYYVNGNI